MPDGEMPVETEEIPSSSASGDAGAQLRRNFVAELFTLHHTSVHRFLSRKVRCDEAAELTQEAYYRLLRQGGILREQSAARALLFRTATNLARDHHRRRLSHRADQHTQIEAQEIAGDQLGPDEQLVREQALSAIERAVAALPADARTVLSLRFSHDLSYGEIARTMKLSTRTVSRKMAEALKRLTFAFNRA